MQENPTGAVIQATKGWKQVPNVESLYERAGSEHRVIWNIELSLNNSSNYL